MNEYTELTSEEAEKLCEANGLRYLGRDPYRNHQHHITVWQDNKTSSYTAGWVNTRHEFLSLLEDMENVKNAGVAK